MVFGVAGGSQLDTGYEIQNSARFDNVGGSALGTTFGTATNDKKFTLSFGTKSLLELQVEEELFGVVEVDMKIFLFMKKQLDKIGTMLVLAQ